MNDNLKIGAAYIRVSTDGQLDYSPESQLDEIKRYAANNGIILDNQYIFIENDGVSGKKAENRMAFQQMIAAAKIKPKPFDVILVWKFSRFARNQDESTFYKSILRKKLGIDVVSVSEPMMEGMYGRLIEMIIEWQDEFYLYNLGQEVRRGMRKKAECGSYNGKMPLGYTKQPGPNTVPCIQESEAYIVRLIFSLFEQGHDKNYIVRHLNASGFKTKTNRVFDNECVSYILENPFYIGKVRWNRRVNSTGNQLKPEDQWIIADAPHEPLISLETWNTCQKRLQQIKSVRSKYAHPVSHTKHWLSGMVKCSICGKSLSWKSGYKNGTDSFQCLGYRNGIHNESQSISAKKLTTAVLKSLHDVLDNSADVKFEITKPHDDKDGKIEFYRKELRSLEQKEIRIRDAYMNGIDTMEEYRTNKEMLARHRKELTQLLEETPETEDISLYRNQFLLNVKNAIEIIESESDFETKAIAFRNIVKRIDFYKDSGTLVFHYYIQA